MLKEKLLEDLKISMRDKNVVRKNTVQMVRAAILQIEKDTGSVVDDEKIIDIIAKEMKKKKDAMADFEKAARQDLISDIGATSMKDMGIVMKESKSAIGAGADGKTINEVVKELLG